MTLSEVIFDFDRDQRLDLLFYVGVICWLFGCRDMAKAFRSKSRPSRRTRHSKDDSDIYAALNDFTDGISKLSRADNSSRGSHAL
jgi:hypothetical protein